MIPPAHLAALKEIMERLEGMDSTWALTGSTSFALQGVPLTVNDIDIQTDERGAYEIDRRLAASVTRPVQFSSVEHIRSHFGQFSIRGIQVDVMGAVQKREPGAAWEAVVELQPLIRFVELEGLRVPVLDLAHEVQAYRMMGRLQRAQMLQDWLNQQKRGGEVCNDIA